MWRTLQSLARLQDSPPEAEDLLAMGLVPVDIDGLIKKLVAGEAHAQEMPQEANGPGSEPFPAFVTKWLGRRRKGARV